MLDLKPLRELGENANARTYIGLDKQAVTGVANETTKDGN
jgi:hypothetical protein